MFTFIVDRLKERSTWLGLIGIISAAGWVMSPDQQNAIAAAGMAIAGAVTAFTADKK
jgi:hypothetical protein